MKQFGALLPSPAPEGGHRRRVLVLEEMFLIAREAERVVRGMGCEVMGPVRTTAAAEELIRCQRPDAAVLKFCAGGESSAALARHLMEHGCPVVLVAGLYRREEVPADLRDLPWLNRFEVTARLGAVLNELLARPGVSSGRAHPAAPEPGAGDPAFLFGAD